LTERMWSKRDKVVYGNSQRRHRWCRIAFGTNLHIERKDFTLCHEWWAYHYSC